MPNAINEDISAMEESSRQPPVTSGLINIPQELRNLILHELWQSAPVIQLKQTSVVGTSVSITINYGPREYHVRQEDSIPGLPSWLLTSRVLLSGGLHQLYRHAIWEWYNDDYPHASRVGYNNPLAGVAMATNFEVLDCRYLRNKDACTIPASSTLTNACQPVELIAPLLSSKLRVLDLTLKIRMHHQDTYALHLSRFGPTSLHLSKLRVCLMLILGAKNSPFDERELAYTEFRAKAESEITEIGRAWVGENRVVHLEEFVWISKVLRSTYKKMYVKGDRVHGEGRWRHETTFTVVRA